MLTYFFTYPMLVLELLLERIWDRFGGFFRPSFLSGASRAVMITGCDTGIGHWLAKLSYELGFIVFAGVLNPESPGAITLTSLDAKRIHVIQLDVCDLKSIRKAYDTVEQVLIQQSHVRFHALINNAGICTVGEMDWLTQEQVDAMLNVNLRGVIQVSRAFMQLLLQHRGRIVNISSINALFPLPALSVYCSSKAGVHVMTEALRSEMYKYGVSVCTLHLGDHAKLTYIMKEQDKRVEQMKRQMSFKQLQFYSHFLNRFQEACTAHSGLTSPTSFQGSLLRHHAKRLLLERSPPYQLICAPFTQVLGYFLVFNTPTWLKLRLFNWVIHKYVN